MVGGWYGVENGRVGMAEGRMEGGGPKIRNRGGGMGSEGREERDCWEIVERAGKNWKSRGAGLWALGQMGRGDGRRDGGGADGWGEWRRDGGGAEG